MGENARRTDSQSQNARLRTEAPCVGLIRRFTNRHLHHLTSNKGKEKRKKPRARRHSPAGTRRRVDDDDEDEHDDDDDARREWGDGDDSVEENRNIAYRGRKRSATSRDSSVELGE
jgi:hypothetical protein